MFFRLLLLLSLFCIGEMAAMPPMPKTQTQKPSLTPPAPQPHPGVNIHRDREPPRSQAIEGLFTSPGIVTWRAGEWVGSEHLYNLSKDLSIDVELIKGTPSGIPVNEDRIKEKIIPALKEIGLNTRFSLFPGQKPLPFLHVLIMINPIEKGYVAYCALRLFEEVQLNRVYLKPGIVWQAITWEKQELIVFPPEKMEEMIYKTIQDMVSSFISVYKQKPEKD